MIDERRLFKMDFNLLLLLKILGEERNSRKAAERMFVTQSAISKGLKKLREQFDDELFIRHKRGIEPTEYCERLLVQLPRIIDSISGLLDEKLDSFEHDYDGVICLAISPTFYKPFSTEILKHFHEKVPNATLKIVNWSWQTEDDLINKHIHVAINYYPLDISKEITQKPISDVTFKLCVRKTHPLAQLTPTLNQIASFPIVVAILPSYASRESHIERILLDAGHNTKVSFQSDQIALCYEKLKISNGIMPIHSSAAVALPEELTLIDIEQQEIVPINKMGIYYSAPTEGAKLTRWVAQEVTNVIKKLN
ncbi:LysR family transcriptional regulator [Vibrio lamellibrachiae]|uniref:LysR family transcriptional regulator n=1 Tax=Vibrio lamellibrachiae TaxID=2910253 RepID=UPI003D11D2E5